MELWNGNGWVLLNAFLLSGDIIEGLIYYIYIYIILYIYIYMYNKVYYCDT
jgi:hypothetical protein